MITHKIGSIDLYHSMSISWWALNHNNGIYIFHLSLLSTRRFGTIFFLAAFICMFIAFPVYSPYNIDKCKLVAFNPMMYWEECFQHSLTSPILYILFLLQEKEVLICQQLYQQHGPHLTTFQPHHYGIIMMELSYILLVAQKMRYVIMHFPSNVRKRHFFSGAIRCLANIDYIP